MSDLGHTMHMAPQAHVLAPQALVLSPQTLVLSPRALVLSPQALRPGLVTGPNPQRDSLSVPERAPWHGLLARCRLGRRGFAPVLRRIRVLETRLLDLADADRAGQLQELLDSLRREPLTAALAERCFAHLSVLCARELQLQPYDVQLHAAWVMLWGGVAELATGEGKTLAVALAGATAAATGIPVHLVSVNDYLVQRDAADLEPLYAAWSLRVGRVVAADGPDARRAAYSCPVTYVSSQQLVFDHLRDAAARGATAGPVSSAMAGLLGRQSAARAVLPGLCFALVDEADSILVDAARTPCVLSQPHPDALDPGQLSMAMGLARQLQETVHFDLVQAGQSAELSEDGAVVLNGMVQALDGPWRNPRYARELVSLALVALHLLRRDRHYIVRDGAVELVDGNTGRRMPDRRLSRGLHQLVELKEDVPVSADNETLGRISYQAFFRSYLHLGGTTGTARPQQRELARVYGLPVVDVPSRTPAQRHHLATRCLANSLVRDELLVARARWMVQTERPMLIGTRSVEDSERISAGLTRAGIGHQVLNAAQDQDEAVLVARAGQAGQITVATNMAGRGTDIPLAEGVAQRGGLHVVVAAINDARRIDRQLVGRCGRQGEPGSWETLISLDDALIASACRPWLMARLRWLARGQGVLWRCCAPLLIGIVQRQAERRHRIQRDLVQRSEEQLQTWLAFRAGPTPTGLREPQ